MAAKELTLEVGPNPTEPNTRYGVSGEGYVPGEDLTVEMKHSKMTYSPRRRNVTVGVDGAFAVEGTSHIAGTIRVTVYRPKAVKDKRGRPQREFSSVATAELVVAEAE